MRERILTRYWLVPFFFSDEAMRQAEQDKTWREREEGWEKEKAAREKLMKDVMIARGEQVCVCVCVCVCLCVCESV